ncbi:MAG: hypothetical protein COX90_03165 [Candidatus Nealsonbacteria bacterium CG_4_10_14_0_2_um_filter_38_17]|uniref:Uncharacterized protein n=1 Tax=Candidatus Nealsonbacteria bacterium CG_4_10_14_0_2_um_filter_38_17 TaxID=1974680 RepID=A0A2M7UXJ2_9BACT|nr:MAG: hypothetical protein COX90_03165 [Candidatus Nealsonbacteria bacterium CG_4_10_14_0_2_um_filter_38_17]
MLATEKIFTPEIFGQKVHINYFVNPAALRRGTKKVRLCRSFLRLRRTKSSFQNIFGSKGIGASVASDVRGLLASPLKGGVEPKMELTPLVAGGVKAPPAKHL